MADLNTWGEARPWLAARVAEIGTAVYFSTRLARLRPVREGAAIAPAVWALPIAGIVVGVVGAAVYAGARTVGLAGWPAAAVALAATFALTGGLHEDGLADTADGFGGGDTRERKLDIMRDSRIGTYGAAALALSIIIRVGALAAIADLRAAVCALIAAHVAARATLPVLMHVLPPARSDGLSFAAGQPTLSAVAVAAALGVLALAGGLRPLPAVAALILLLVVIAFMARLSHRQIGGQTGDVLGALEQAGEIAVLLVASAAVG